MLSDVFQEQSQFVSVSQWPKYLERYRIETKRGEDAFSQIFIAYSLETEQRVTIKIMKKTRSTIDRVKKLKELQALKILSPHDNVINLIEVLYNQSSGRVALVFEFMEQNLYQCLMTQKDMPIQKVKYLMYSLLRSIAHMHKQGIFHRQIMPENVMVTRDVLKLANFNSCLGIYHEKPYTEYISSRWYRAPECLMTDGYYDQKMDIWGYGCVMFEMITKYPLFAGHSEIDQIYRINKVLGTPSEQLLNRFKSKATHMQSSDWNFPYKKGIGLEKLMPCNSKEMLSLMNQLLEYDPVKRISAQQALNHQYFAQFAEKQTISKFNSAIKDSTAKQEGVSVKNNNWMQKARL